ncbi:MAG: DUF11 domain-containing protein, partial [Xanthomonadales bacterium]|nr:DUF11 domain-containing protein [Xanthomonadales bacterium]
ATVTVASPPPQPDFAFRSIVGNPDPVDPNGRGQFVLVVEDAQISTRGVRSADGITAPSVSFTLDSTPSGVILGVPAGTNWLCNSSGCDYTANVSPSNPTEPLTIPFSAPSSGPGSITLQAQILGDTNTANNQGQAQVAIAGAGGVDLSFARFDVAPASVLVDEQIEYRVAIQNVGGRGFIAGDPGFTYTLSSDAGTATLLGTPSGSNWNCTASGCSYSGSLNAGEVSSEVRFSVRAPAVGPNAVTLSGEIFGDIDPSNNQGSATAQVEAAPPPEPVQLTLDKQGPADVEAGASFDYQIVVSNTGAVTARQLQVVDFLPDGLALLGVSADLGWSCQNIGSRVDCQRSSLEVGQSTQISLQARLDDPGEYVNRVELTAQDLASNLSDQVVTVVRAPGARVDLRLRKSDVADPVVAGGTVVYLLDVINIGTLPATDVTLIDELPDDLTLLSATGPGWSCSGNVVCKLAGALADGASAQLRIEAQAPTGNANILNQASVSSAEVDLNPQDNVDDEQTTITGSVGAAVADLALTGGPTALTTIGESFALTADVGNLGPDAAQGIQLTGQLDPAAELLSATLGTQSCSVTGSSFSCLLGGLESGANLGLSIQARAVQIQGGVLQLQLTAQTDDPRLANNAASVSFAVRTNGSADLSVSGSATPDPVPSGGIVQYTAALRNEGPDPVTDASYSIVLSEGQIILDVSGSGLSCVNAAALATCQLTGELVVGAQRQATLRAQVSAAAGSTIEAQIINLAPLDPNPTNDRATVRVQVGERSEEGIRDQLGGSAGSDPTAGAAVSPVAEQCADPSPALADFCDDLLQASDAEVRDALAATAPEESLSQAVLAREVSFAQFFNIDARLAELRGATGGFSSAGLMLSGSGGSLPLGQLLAGEDADDSGGLFGSPWGFFIN